MTPTTIILDRPERVEYAQKMIGRLPVSDRAWDVSIAPHIDRRTDSQNRRLWALHRKAGDHCGCSAFEMHEEMLCEHFGANEVKMPNGQVRRVPLKRSSQRNKAEFAAFMEFVESFYISRLGVFLGDNE